MSFSSKLWGKIAPLYQKIIAHPFNVELSKGTLNINKFQFYIRQDVIYLEELSRTLALIAGRARSSETVQQFLNCSLETIINEKNLLINYIKPLERQSIELSSTCLGFTQFLLATAATGSLGEAIAAVLPGFLIYREVGNWIVSSSERDNPYIDWIDTYSSPEFSKVVNLTIALLDGVANEASPSELQRMEKAFVYSTIFELNFWDDAYHMRVFREPILGECHEQLLCK